MLNDPVYNIGVVTRLTGIPAATLHAWERRYGFPKLARTPAGHRLYSNEDIALLRQVKEKIASGLKASLAIAAVRTHGTGDVLSTASPALDHLSHALVELLASHDLTRADQLLGDALAFHSPDTLTLEVIGPSFAAIGQSWEDGHMSVATEHLASGYLRRRLLAWMASAPAPRPIPPVVLACVPGEWHEGGLLMLGVLLRRRGVPVSYLGQNVPFIDLAAFIKETPPSVLVLTAMQQETARYLTDWPHWIKLEKGRPLVAFGGRAYVQSPALAKRTQGLYLGDTIQEGLACLVEHLPE
jgi:DNA-binding transcriptional MerR regulator